VSPTVSAFESWLDRLLDAQPEQQIALLKSISETDPPLAQALKEALAAVAASEHFLERPAQPDDANPSAPPDVGECIGAWRLLTLIGSGGMGAVWEVERADGAYTQRAALKLMKSQASRQHAHFLRERQVLAALNHPGILRLLDGGEVNGRLYLVTELIDGDDLAQWVKTRQPDLATRLAVFSKIAEAVSYAHAHFVVHRDIKPENILLDKQGVPYLIDFGIAKLLSAMDESAAQTLILTPEFAAPEQVTGASISARTDVYALGALLYWLLTGEPPFTRNELGFQDILNKICQELPAAPKQRELAKPINVSTYSSDLDIITLCALQKAPQARYQSVEAMLVDLRNVAAYRPINARAPSRWYIATRYLRRHRLAIAVASTIFSLLLAGLIGTWWQARIAAHERDLARVARDEAMTETKFNSKLKDFMVEILRLDAEHQGALDLSALLEQGAQRLQQQNGANENERALSASAIADLHEERRDFARAAKVLDEALDRANSSHTLGDKIVNRLRCQRADIYAQTNDYSAAIAMANLVLQAPVQGPADTAQIPISCLQVRAMAYAQTNQPAAAIIDLQAALRACKQSASGCAPTDESGLYNSLSNAYASSRNYSGAMQALNQSLHLLEQAGRGETSDAASVHGNYANLLNDIGLCRAADAQHKAATALRRKVSGDSPAVAKMLINWASSVNSQGDGGKALDILSQAQALTKKFLPPGSMHEAMIHIQSAYAYALLGERGQTQRALALAREVAKKLANAGLDERLDLLEIELSTYLPMDFSLRIRGGQLLEKRKAISTNPKTWLLSALFARSEQRWLDVIRGALRARDGYSKNSDPRSYRIAQIDLLLGMAAYHLQPSEQLLSQIREARTRFLAQVVPAHPLVLDVDAFLAEANTRARSD
jgi:eukaryotic-like serine/threonine-protein kinase